MVRWLAGSASIVALATASTATPAVAAPHLPCRPSHSKVVQTGPSAEVYERSSGRPPEQTAAFYACVHGRRGAILLRGYGAEHGQPLALNGTVVAYSFYRREDEEELVVLNLRSGRVLHDPILAAVRSGIPVFFTELTVRQIVVKPDGAVAWLQRNEYANRFSSGPPPTYSIYALDTAGFHRWVLDAPAAPQRFRLSGDTVSWTLGAVGETAVLQ
jgi:hypothetical protein